MLTVGVKTLYLGWVAVRGRYLKEAIDDKEDLQILHDGSVMVIKNAEIYSRIVGKSDKRYSDKFLKFPPDFIYYYDWKPVVEQAKML